MVSPGTKSDGREVKNMAKATATTLVDDLRRAIRDSGHSLTEIEKRCGVSHAVLSRFLRGQRTITLPLASRLCDALGLHLCKRENGGEAVTGGEAEAPPEPPKRERRKAKRTT
jgi:transcriptional regulator with XRE-family HTH domain